MIYSLDRAEVLLARRHRALDLMSHIGAGQQWLAPILNH